MCYTKGSVIVWFWNALPKAVPSLVLLEGNGNFKMAILVGNLRSLGRRHALDGDYQNHGPSSFSLCLLAARKWADLHLVMICYLPQALTDWNL